jgi:hypothetical protein
MLVVLVTVLALVVDVITAIMKSTGIKRDSVCRLSISRTMATCVQMRLPIHDAVGDQTSPAALPVCLGDCTKLKSCHVLSSSDVDALLQPVAGNALRAETIRLQCFSTSDPLQLHEHFNDYITQPLCLVAACGSACVAFKFVVSCGSCSLDATIVVPPDFPSRPSIAVVNSVTVGNKGNLSEVRRHVEAEVNHALLADLSHANGGQLPPSTLALQVKLHCAPYATSRHMNTRALHLWHLCNRKRLLFAIDRHACKQVCMLACSAAVISDCDSQAAASGFK